jgi:hypothetical protein
VKHWPIHSQTCLLLHPQEKPKEMEMKGTRMAIATVGLERDDSIPPPLEGTTIPNNIIPNNVITEPDDIGPDDEFIETLPTIGGLYDIDLANMAPVPIKMQADIRMAIMGLSGVNIVMKVPFSFGVANILGRKTKPVRIQRGTIVLTSSRPLGANDQPVDLFLDAIVALSKPGKYVEAIKAAMKQKTAEEKFSKDAETSVGLSGVEDFKVFPDKPPEVVKSSLIKANPSKK